MLFTRQQYLNHECSHAAYYGQFCTPQLIRVVAQHIGGRRICAALAAGDEHLNSIPLGEWDRLLYLVREYLAPDAWKAANPAGAGFSLSDAVCIAKEAARRYSLTAPATLG